MDGKRRILGASGTLARLPRCESKNGQHHSSAQKSNRPTSTEMIRLSGMRVEHD
jgi:hypothetical protein